MYAFTQNYYDCIMEYVGLNQRAAGLMSTTKYTGFVRWHERNHEVYDKYNQKITKYIANMYGEVATAKNISSFSYSMPSSITTHIEAWKAALEPMKMATYEMYCGACEIGDLMLACYFKELNKLVNNECFALKRLCQRLKGATESDVMIVNKEIHDYFEENHECESIDISL